MYFLPFEDAMEQLMELPPSLAFNNAARFVAASNAACPSATPASISSACLTSYQLPFFFRSFLDKRFPRRAPKQEKEKERC